MTKSQIDGTALLAAVVASAFGFSLLNGTYFWIASIAGLCLAVVLLAFDREGQRSVFESLAFAAVVGLTLTLAATLPIAWLRHNPANGPFAGPIPADWLLPYVWIGATVLVAIIDRARMGGRVSYAAQIQPAAVSFRPTPVMVSNPEPPARTTYEAPARPVYETPAPPTPPPPTPKPTFTRPSFSDVAPEPPPIVETPRVVERAPEPMIATPPPAPPAVHMPPPVATPDVAAAQQAMAVPPGKEATIYVSLVGEGLNVLRAVRAEHMGRDFYRIAEPMPDGEVWQFGPGQVVRCRKKNLSSGKAMVAMEEAPRAS